MERFPESQKTPLSTRADNAKYMEMVNDNLDEILDLANRLSKDDHVDLDGLKGIQFIGFEDIFMDY